LVAQCTVGTKTPDKDVPNVETKDALGGTEVERGFKCLGHLGNRQGPAAKGVLGQLCPTKSQRSAPVEG